MYILRVSSVVLYMRNLMFAGDVLITHAPFSANWMIQGLFTLYKLLISSPSNSSNSNITLACIWKAMWILMKPADLDLHCLKKFEIWRLWCRFCICVISKYSRPLTCQCLCRWKQENMRKVICNIEAMLQVQKKPLEMRSECNVRVKVNQNGMQLRHPKTNQHTKFWMHTKTIYVAYMRFIHIDKKNTHPNKLDSNSSHE